MSQPSRVRTRMTRDDRRAQIVDAAMELFARRGYHEVGVQDIADELGISVGLIYRYAASKQELLALALQGLMDSYEIAIDELGGEGDAAARLERGFGQYLHAIDARRTHLVMSYTELRRLDDAGIDQMKAHDRKINDAFARTIQDGVDIGLFRPDTRPLIAAANLRMSAHAWALRYWQLREAMDVDEYAAYQLRANLRALGAAG